MSRPHELDDQDRREGALRPLGDPRFAEQMRQASQAAGSPRPGRLPDPSAAEAESVGTRVAELDGMSTDPTPSAADVAALVRAGIDISVSDASLPYRLARALEQVQAARERAEARLLDRESALTIEELTVRAGKVDLRAGGPGAQAFAVMLGEFFIQQGAENYVEMHLCDPRDVRYTLTCQKATGKTPHELRLAAEGERDRLREELAMVTKHRDELLEGL